MCTSMVSVYDLFENRCIKLMMSLLTFSLLIDHRGGPISSRSQMTSKCSKNKKVARQLLGKCVTDVLTTFAK